LDHLKLQIGIGVFTITIRILGSDFGSLMDDMRTWFDSRRITPNRFNYVQDVASGMIAITVTFDASDDQAAAFIDKFGGEPVTL
jgi:hypothetical protein